jgi:hypothetical protein
MLLIAHRPAHSPVPAAAKHQDRCASHTSCYQTEGNLPTRLLFFRHQNPATNREPTAEMILAVLLVLASVKTGTNGGTVPKRNIAITANPL